MPRVGILYSNLACTLNCKLFFSMATLHAIANNKKTIHFYNAQYNALMLQQCLLKQPHELFLLHRLEQSLTFCIKSYLLLLHFILTITTSFF